MTTQYKPPQVIVQGKMNQVLSTEYTRSKVIAIVGRMDKYPHNTVSRVLGNGTTVTIQAKNIFPASIKLTAYDGTVLVKDKDYIQSIDNKQETFSITVTRQGMRTQSILISYEYLPDKFFEPNKWYTKNAVAKFYGSAFDDDNYVDCPLTAAAEYAFDNGAEAVCILPVIDSKENKNAGNPIQTLNDALEKLKLHDDISLIIPANLNEQDLMSLKSYIQWRNKHALECRGIFGLDGTGHDYSIEQLMQISQSFDDLNIMFIPNTIAPVHVMDARNAINLPGWLFSAAVAGLASTTPPYYSLIRKSLAGFYGVQGFLVEEKDQLASAGACVIEMVNGIIRIRDSVTTWQKSLTDWSYSGVYNWIVQAMRAILDPYIGQPSNDIALSEIKSLSERFLDHQVEEHMIYNYRDLEVTRRNNNPSIIDVTFAYAWASPIKYIYVNFSVDMAY